MLSSEASPRECDMVIVAVFLGCVATPQPPLVVTRTVTNTVYVPTVVNPPVDTAAPSMPDSPADTGSPSPSCPGPVLLLGEDNGEVVTAPGGPHAWGYSSTWVGPGTVCGADCGIPDVWVEVGSYLYGDILYSMPLSVPAGETVSLFVASSEYTPRDKYTCIVELSGGMFAIEVTVQ